MIPRRVKAAGTAGGWSKTDEVELGRLGKKKGALID